MYTTDDRADYIEQIADAARTAYATWPAGSPLHAAIPGYLAGEVSEVLMGARALGEKELRSLVCDGLAAAGHTDPTLADLISGITLSDPIFEGYPSLH